MKPLFTGPIVNNPVNRPLTDYEIENRLSHKERSPSPPWYQLSVIRMNSTYLECTDTLFSTKGIMTTITLPLMSMSTWLLVLWGPYTLLSRGPIEKYLSVSLFSFFGGIFLIWLGTYLNLSKECLRYTHTPIRFNRKTRKVYMLRWDGTVMVEPWERLHFIPVPSGFGNWKIGCHRLAKDNNTILESFIMPYMADKDKRFLFSQWEFVRRYMEEPDELPHLADQVESVMAIYDRRETWLMGLKRLWLEFGGGTHWIMAILAFPFAFLFSFGRWVAFHTCWIPRWPIEVEAKCAFFPDDPYLRDRKHLAKPGTVKKPGFMR